MFLKTVHIAWLLFQLFILIQLVFPVLSYLFYLIKKKRSFAKNSTTQEADYAIIVTAYKETGNLPNVIQSLLKLNYSNYLIYVVADNCTPFDPGTTDSRVIILYPEPALSNQLKSHFYAISNFKRKHDRLTIIDSDNLVDANYLR